MRAILAARPSWAFLLLWFLAFRSLPFWLFWICAAIALRLHFGNGEVDHATEVSVPPTLPHEKNPKVVGLVVVGSGIWILEIRNKGMPSVSSPCRNLQ